MKKLKVLGLAAIAAGMVTLTSCLDGGGNQESGQLFAVIDYSSTFKPLLYTPAGAPFYISSVASDPSFNAGDCVTGYITVDYDSPENANASTNGYYTASGQAATIKKGNFSFAALDSTALSDEQLLSGVANMFIKSVNYRKMIALPMFEKILTEQKNNYKLTFDYDQEPITVNSVERVYTFCLRCQKLEDGKAPTLNNVSDISGFDLEQLYSTLKSKESAAGKKVVNYQIKYAKGFNSESTKVTTWGATDIVQFSIVDSAE